MKFISLLALLFLFACAHNTKAPAHQEGASILQLVTTENAAEFNVLLARSARAKFIAITPSGETVIPTDVHITDFPHSNWVMHHVRFSGLPTAMGDYHLVVETNGRILDQRTFRLFSNQGERLKFVIGSCADVRHKEQGKMWASVEAQKPEWLFMIGDNVYAVQGDRELKSPELIWDRYVESRQALDFYRWKTLIPTHSVWDDNDYGQNNGGAGYALKADAQRIFKAFFLPQFPSENLVYGPGIASRLNLRGMHFTFLDNRSFRDNGNTDGEHFGPEQEEWLFQDLKTSQLPTWIISGDQFFGGYHKYDSYEGNHPRAFENFLKQLKEIPTPFVFVSGDRHMTEVMQFPRALLGQLSFEFTTSPFHSKIYPKSGMADANPWRVVGRDDALNFMSFETWLEESSWNLNLRSIDEKAATLFGRDLSLTTEALKDFTIEKKQRRRKYRRARWRKR